MNHRPSGGPGTKRPGPLAREDVRNSWGPSWGLGRVLASSLLTSPPPLRAGPCSPRAPAWNPGLAAASAPTVGSARLGSAQLSSAQLATAEAAPRVLSEAAQKAPPEEPCLSLALSHPPLSAAFIPATETLPHSLPPRRR